MENRTLPVKFTEQYFAYARGLSTPEGTRQAKLSLQFGVVGLFIMGIFLGFLAVFHAHRAEKFGTRATAGKILGYVDIVLGIGLSFLIITLFAPLI